MSETVPIKEPLTRQEGWGENLTYSIDEAAAIIGVSYFTVWRLLQRGKLRAIAHLRRKRIPRKELERFIGDIR